LEATIAAHAEILDRAKTGQPLKEHELSAFAYMLLTLYTDIEAIFKLISQTFDGGPKDSASWHSDLFRSMAKQSAKRPAVLSPALHAKLREYMDFRHFSTYATAAVLDWDKMAPLVLGAETLLADLKVELQDFLLKVDTDPT
jgi:hypothetical protein